MGTFVCGRCNKQWPDIAFFCCPDCYPRWSVIRYWLVMFVVFPVFTCVVIAPIVLLVVWLFS